METIFWSLITLILYTYLGYGLVLAAFRFFKRKKDQSQEETWELPVVTLLIAAYNEEDYLREKLANTLALDYPSARLEIVVVTDGSTDSSPDIVQEFPFVKLLHHPERRGKVAAINRAMQHIHTPITVISDANTNLPVDGLRHLIAPFQDAKVGAVAGEKQVIKPGEQNATAGEGLYWQYESWLKQMDSEFGTVVGAAGELLAYRTELFEHVAEDTIIEDFVFTLTLASKGHKVAYAPQAIALETTSANLAEERKRKVRISAGAFQAIARLSHLANPFRFGKLTFQYLSHRVFRWTVAPLALLLLIPINLYLAFTTGNTYLWLGIGQALFYTLGLLGYALRTRAVPIRGFFAPYYFLMMNSCVVQGLWRHLHGHQRVTWEKAARA